MRVRNSKGFAPSVPVPDSARIKIVWLKRFVRAMAVERLRPEITRNPGPESQNEILRHLCSLLIIVALTIPVSHLCLYEKKKVLPVFRAAVLEDSS